MRVQILKTSYYHHKTLTPLVANKFQEFLNMMGGACWVLAKLYPLHILFYKKYFIFTIKLFLEMALSLLLETFKVGIYKSLNTTPMITKTISTMNLQSGY